MWRPGKWGRQRTLHAKGTGAWLTCRKSNKEAGVVGAERARGNALGEEAEELTEDWRALLASFRLWISP